MPSLFTLPKQVAVSSLGAPLASANLYFYATGTSTPQNTYQDEALTTPHSNPVVADAAGVFAVIYFDPALPDYRVRLETSAAALVYQVDGIPSGQDEAQTFRLTSVAPELIFDETDGSATNRKWRIRVNSEAMTIDVGNDAESTWVNVATIERTANVVDSITFAAAVALASATIAGATVATQENGTYTGTLTGLTTSPTTTVSYRRAGGLVVLTYSDVSGTSNTTALSMTGMPAAIRPAAARQGIYVTVLENGTQQVGRVTVNTSGDLTYSVGAAGGVFTNSGSKGAIAATIAYML